MKTIPEQHVIDINIQAEQKEPLQQPPSRDSVVGRSSSLWKGCGCLIDKRCLMFSSKLAFSFIILIFACGQIVRNSDACSNSLLSWYCSIIGVILGTFTNMGEEKRYNPVLKSNQKPSRV